MRARVLILVISLIALSSCAEKWVKPGAEPGEFEQMKAACLSQAAARYPSILRQVQVTNGYTTPIVTNCSGFGYSVSCYTTGGQYIPPTFITVDDNQNARNQDTRNCFYQNGWITEKEYKASHPEQSAEEE